MRKLVFAKKINGTDETGLIDIAKNPPELFCLCEEDKANEILNLNKVPVGGLLEDRLFELANDFAIAKKGDVAVKLHSIFNGLQ